jgi:hypothetical protein
VILTITGCFHLYRGAPVDGAVFLGVAAWLAVVETRTPAARVAPVAESEALLPQRLVLVGAPLVVAALTLAPRYGRVDVVLVGALGLVAVVVAATRGEGVVPVRRGRAWPYAVVGLVAALNELTAYLLETSPAADWRHPAFSDVMDPVLGWAPARGLLVLAWLAAGIWLLRAMPAGRPVSAGAPESEAGERTS